MPRKLRVEFPTEEAFRREYVDNISKGGTFIATRETFDPREFVSVELVLVPMNETITMEGEVVHCVPPELASTGATPGVAIQFRMEAEGLRARFSDYALAAFSQHEQEFGAGRRAAPRSRVRASVQVAVAGKWRDGRLRNISNSGVLVAVSGEPVPVGEEILVCLVHPTSLEDLELPGFVRRHVDSTGEVCLGIEFEIPEAQQAEFESFLASLRTNDHNRRLGGINGPIADLGIERLIEMFGSSAPVGTLCLYRGDDEGLISFDHGTLRAKLGKHTGRAALAALLEWSDGHFEFDVQIEPLPTSEELAFSELFGTPEVEAAALEQAGALENAAALEKAADDEKAAALAQAAVEPEATDPDADGEELLELVDVVEAELELPDGSDELDTWDDSDEFSASKLAIDVAPIPDQARLSVGDERCEADSDDLSKTEQALLDLARAGMTVGQAIDIIPEASADIYAALTGLIAMGAISIA